MKQTPYEESIEVPMVVRGPGIRGGVKKAKMVLNNDLAPTFAELAGVPFSADGRSLVPLLRGQSPPWRDAFLVEDQGIEVDPGYHRTRP